MANGIPSTFLSPSDVADELIGSRNGSTVRIQGSKLAAQLLASEEFSDRLALIDDQLTAFAGIGVYETVAAGLAATSVGDQFLIQDADEIIRYEHQTGGTEIELLRTPSVAFIDAVLGRQFISFSEAGVYDVNGNVTQAFGGLYKEQPISKSGIYEIGWNLGGSVRYMHAADASGNLLASWNGDVISPGTQIVVPGGATKLLLSSFGSPQNGYLTHIETRADGAVRGIISVDEVNALAAAAVPDSAQIYAAPNEVEHFDMNGNPWTDGLWRNAESDLSMCRVYTISDAETYMLHYVPSVSYEQALSSAEIKKQLATNASFSGMTHNGSLLNNLLADCDDVTVNNYVATTGRWASEWTPPAGAKRLIVLVKNGAGTVIENVRLFKSDGRARGYLAGNPNSGKRIVVCGDSVAQATEAEVGKSRLRGLLGSRVDTYAIGGAGWSINATPSWVTPNNVSGVYQIEELVKPGAMAYDIYCLSATLNDPVTHNKPIGSIDNCVPYLRNSGDPDLTDPNLDTMLGALNFAVQRIYEKNPSAKIVIATMNKVFLTAATSGFGLAAGYDPADVTTNSHGSTYYEYVQAVRSLGDRWGIPIVDVYGEAGINEFNKDELMIDQYHPTVAGYASIWSLWLDAILKV